MKNNNNKALSIIIITGIIIVLNLLSYRIFTRIDLSKNKIYSLSKESKNLVGSLKDPLTVKVYFTKNLPAPYSNLERFVRDKLEDYKAYSKGKFNFQIVSPDEENKMIEEALSYKIPQLKMQVLENDQFTVKNAFMGMVFIYQNKTETIPIIKDASLLEYDITKIIDKLTSKRKIKIGFVNDFSYDSNEKLMQALSEDYEIKEITISDSLTIDSLDVVAIIKPYKNMDEKTQRMLENYLEKGGNMLFALNGVEAVLDGKSYPYQVKNNWIEWIRKYGVRINNDLVYDKFCGNVKIDSGYGFYNAIPYPYFPKIANLNRENIITSSIETITSFFPSSLDTIKNDKYIFEPLYYSSQNSGKISERFFIDPFEGTKNLNYGNEKILLAGILKNKENGGRIMVLGDGNIFIDRYIIFADDNNLQFILNSFDWLANKTSLIGIRNKDIPEVPIIDVSVKSKNLLKFLNVFFAPILFLIYGIYRWKRNKKLRGEYEL